MKYNPDYNHYYHYLRHDVPAPEDDEWDGEHLHQVRVHVVRAQPGRLLLGQSRMSVSVDIIL